MASPSVSMIIRKIGFLVCMLVVCSLNINTAMAQSRSYEGVITVNPVRLEQKGDFIHVDIDFVLNNVVMDKIACRRIMFLETFLVFTAVAYHFSLCFYTFFGQKMLLRTNTISAK